MTAAPGTTLELITVGRICVDLYANEAGASFLDPQTFTKSVGGTATNVAIAAARLGRRAAVFTSDAIKQYVVDLSAALTSAELRLPLAPVPAFAGVPGVPTSLGFATPGVAGA